MLVTFVKKKIKKKNFEVLPSKFYYPKAIRPPTYKKNKRNVSNVSSKNKNKDRTSKNTFEVPLSKSHRPVKRT